MRIKSYLIFIISVCELWLVSVHVDIVAYLQYTVSLRLSFAMYSTDVSHIRDFIDAICYAREFYFEWFCCLHDFSTFSLDWRLHWLVHLLYCYLYKYVTLCVLSGIILGVSVFCYQSRKTRIAMQQSQLLWGLRIRSNSSLMLSQIRNILKGSNLKLKQWQVIRSLIRICRIVTRC